MGKDIAHQEIAKDQGHTQFMKDHPNTDKNCYKECQIAHQHTWQNPQFDKEYKTSHEHNLTDMSHQRVEEHEKMDKNIKENLETEKKIKEEQDKNQKEQEEEHRKKMEKEMLRSQAREEAQREMNLKIATKGGHEPSKMAGFTESVVGSVTQAMGHLVGDTKMQEKGKILKEEGKAEMEASKHTDTAKANAHKVAGIVSGHVNQTQPLIQDK